jgi:hypothetical protein
MLQQRLSEPEAWGGWLNGGRPPEWQFLANHIELGRPIIDHSPTNLSGQSLTIHQPT